MGSLRAILYTKAPRAARESFGRVFSLTPGYAARPPRVLTWRNELAYFVGVVMELRQIVDRYLAASGGYGKVAPLSALGLSRAEAESAFNVLDEDYNISRYFHFQCAAGANFTINGFPQTHLSIDAEIQSIL
jgi:hypothetical protein